MQVFEKKKTAVLAEGGFYEQTHLFDHDEKQKNQITSFILSITLFSLNFKPRVVPIRYKDMAT